MIVCLFVCLLGLKASATVRESGTAIPFITIHYHFKDFSDGGGDPVSYFVLWKPLQLTNV